MMSDHWKKLANLLGTPGPADPPETAAKSDAGDVPAAKKPEPVRPAPPTPAPIAAQPAVPHHPPASHTPPRKRSSMWGDDLESEATPADKSGADVPAEQRVTPADLPTPRRSDSPARSSQFAERPATERPSAERQPAERPVADRLAPERQPAERPFGERRAAEPARGEAVGRRRSDEPTEKPAAARASDTLGEMAVVKREPPVPGFDVPESRSPERPEAPAKRSAWDTLISTLGIKPAAEPEEQRPRAEAPAPERRKPEPVETADFGGFGAGLVDAGDTPRRSEAAASVGRVDEPSRRRDEPAGDREADDDRRRGRGRRGTARHRGLAEEPARESAAEIGWDPEPSNSPARRSPIDEPTGDRPRRSEERPAGDPRSAGDVRPEAFGAEEGDSDETRRRRPRRRGQRQTLSLSDTELDRPAREPRSDSDLGPARREESGGRDRGPRRDRGEDPRGERSPRPPRSEEGRRGEPRPARRRPDVDEPQLQDDDELGGFGGDLLAEVSPPRSGDDEGPSRPRRRRGRRGRGGAAPRSEEALRAEEAPRSEADIEEDDPWAPVSAAPEFDDDYEDDDEAEQLRRRSRGGRTRTPRREAAASTRGDAAPVGADEPVRPERLAAAKQYSAPTWLETVTLLVDANIQRRGSGGGGSSRGPQGGRGGRR